MTDEQHRAGLDALASHDRLSWLIGRLAQTSVGLDQNLRSLWLGLVGIGPGWQIVPNRTGDLIEHCRRMVPKSRLVGRALDAAIATLDEAAAANRERHRAVHDWWSASLNESGAPADPPAFTRRRFKPYEMLPTASTVTLDDVERSLNRLYRATIRVVSVQFAVQDFAFTPHEWEQQLRMIEGRFELLPDGGARPLMD